MTDSSSNLVSLPIPIHDPDSLGREILHRRIHERLFDEPMTPVRLGRFIVKDTLGRGGMGIVYAGWDELLKRSVAIKIIHNPLRGRTKQSRVLSEAQAQARLSHPNVVSIYEVTESGSDIFIVMEFIAGVTVDRWLAARQRSVPEILDVFIQAGRGLAAAHGVGVVHRDIKPSNILVGSDGRVRLADFGLARARAEDVGEQVSSQPSGGTTSAGSSDRAAGTPAYMSPEHLRGNPDARSDQYSFCVALYEALHGAHPFPGQRAPDEVDQPISLRFERGSESSLRRLLVRGLSLRPEARHASMEAIVIALERRPRRQFRPVLGFVAGALSVLVVGAALQRHSQGHTSLVDDRETCVEHQRRQAEIAWRTYSHTDSLYSGDYAALLRNLSEHVDCQQGAASSLPDERLRATLEEVRHHQYNGTGLQALPLLARALEEARDDRTRADLLLRRARIEADDGSDPGRAEKTLNQGLAQAIRADDVDLAWQITNYQAFLSIYAFQEPDKARQRLELARSYFSRLPDHPRLAQATMLDTEVQIALLKGDYSTALDLRQQTLRMREEVLPYGNVELAQARLDVAGALAGLDLGSAQAQFLELAAAHRDQFGDSHPLTARTEFNVAQGYYLLGQPARARAALLRCRDIFAGLYGSASERVAETELYLARVALAQGDGLEVERHGHRALAIYEARYPTDFSERVNVLAVLGEQARIDERWADLLAYSRSLLSYVKDGGQGVNVPDLLTIIGDALCKLDRCAESLSYYAEVSQHLEGEPPSLQAYPLQGLGLAYLNVKNPALAQVYLEQALNLLRSDRASSPQMQVQTARSLAQSLRQQRIQPGRVRQLLAWARALESKFGK